MYSLLVPMLLQFGFRMLPDIFKKSSDYNSAKILRNGQLLSSNSRCFRGHLAGKGNGHIWGNTGLPKSEQKNLIFQKQAVMFLIRMKWHLEVRHRFYLIHTSDLYRYNF